MPSEYLSELEELILLAVAACYPDAYAYALKKEIKTQAKRGLSLATVDLNLRMAELYAMYPAQAVILACMIWRLVGELQTGRPPGQIGMAER